MNYEPIAMNSFRVQDPLMEYEWPPVMPSTGLTGVFAEFVNLSPAEQRFYLESLRADSDRHGRFLQTSLSTIYAYCFGYGDSPVHETTDANLEIKLQTAKILLECEMLEHWLSPELPPEGLNQTRACDYLRRYVENNSGVYHRFFDYVRDEMPESKLVEFLQFEAVRNEVVDDEVALIVVGLQGQLKSVMASNLWDECGNGNITRFHTYWLRRLLTRLGTMEDFPQYREVHLPWFPSITSNSFNMMATRSGYKYRAYGSFLINESWVNPHFERILAGMKRVGRDHDDLTVYFTKHFSIDPHHTEQMLEALAHQQPRLTAHEVREVLWGAHTAVAAGTRLYNESLKYFKGNI